MRFIWLEEDFSELIAFLDKHKNSTATSAISLDSAIFCDDDIITSHDVDCMEQNDSVMFYDAFLLYADKDKGDEEFAFEIKSVLEKRYFFTICTRHDFLPGVSFEHDAIMQLIDQRRCDKLIVIISKSFCHQFREAQDDLTRFIIKFAQSLQIREFSSTICVAISFSLLTILQTTTKKSFPALATTLESPTTLKATQCSIFPVQADFSAFGIAWLVSWRTAESPLTSEKSFKKSSTNTNSKLKNLVDQLTGIPRHFSAILFLAL